ncbi:MAG: hypothetical protein PHS34_07865 [Candidatus Omnitrophica bacterium]|jgi:hypothetical protein|nr:hypothetical protein [Candidatus Omnitrophota bacterium]
MIDQITRLLEFCFRDVPTFLGITLWILIFRGTLSQIFSGGKEFFSKVFFNYEKKIKERLAQKIMEKQSK